jgi:hypothetical protein
MKKREEVASPGSRGFDAAGLLRPTSGDVKVFGLNPATNEVAVKSRLTYVPDHVAFYPWMTVSSRSPPKA